MGAHYGGPFFMITIHHLNHSRSQRILWLLEELELPYEIKHYERDPKTMLAPASLKKIHPLGKSPALTDGEITVVESGAIVEYLIDTYGAGRLKPTAPELLRRYRYWLHYAEGSAMMPLILTLVFNKIQSTPVPFFMRPLIAGICQTVRASFINPQLKLHFDYVNGELAKSPWLAGDLSGADVMMSFPIEAAVARGKQDWPELKAFVERIKARPAYQRALARGGDYQIL